MNKNKQINVIGGGLAGSEACYQLLKKGYTVNLFEMKPNKFSPAHKNENFAELVCSNSLKSNDVNTAGGLLKQELRKLDSLLISVADSCQVPAGGALAVDREQFSQLVTDKLKEFDNLNIINQEVENIDFDIPTIIATGPLTSEKLSNNLQQLLGDDYLYFFDAIAPIVSIDNINFDVAFFGDRYDKGTKDYINCPFNKEQYLNFYNNLIEGEIVKLKDFENFKVYEGCMPIEVLAKRGVDTMRFGPLKPVGITNPHQEGRPYAVVQLRKETLKNDFYNLVGFQTNLTYGEQKRIFSLIPGLENVEFLRYGNMHKNTYINAPKLMNKYYQLKNHSNVFIAGQLSGVEGYIESIQSGLMCAINMDRLLQNKELIHMGKYTIMGALSNYLESARVENFQPMSANMGLINYGDIKIKDKKEKNKFLSNRALESLDKIILDNQL